MEILNFEKKQIIISTFVYDETTLEFQIADLDTHTMYVVVGDLETLQSTMVETYRPNSVVLNTPIPYIKKRLEEVGFEVELMLHAFLLQDEE